MSSAAVRQRTLRSGGDLAAAEFIAQSDVAAIDALSARYGVALTPDVVALIAPGVADDPIARQFVPSLAELDAAPNERADPIGDAAHSPVEGIVHRYPDRALLKLVHICPVYCRFCFRREMVGPGKAQALGKAALARALAYVGAHPEIWELIITGGDPFSISAARMRGLMTALGRIPHLKIIRFHTRVPVVDAAHIDAEFVDALRAAGKTVYVALHANHARELTEGARAACARMIDAGLPMLSQSVLLKGVNNSVEALDALFRAFAETRIKPYYLHHPDLAPGTAHFRVPIAEGQALMRALRGRLSGLCLPEYVLDIPGGFGKSPIGPNYVHDDGGTCAIEDFNGARHDYAG